MSNSNWKLEKNKNGIKVFTHIPEGAELKEIKMSSTANATLSQAAAVLLDVDEYPRWIYNCNQAKIIKRISKHEILYYSNVKAPWPVSDRDVVANNKIFQNPKTKVVFSESTANIDVLPSIDDKVRIKKFYGLWKITPIEKNKIKIEYYLKINPGGKLPVWVVNLFIANAPYQSMLNFKRQLNEDKYQNVSMNFIKD